MKTRNKLLVTVLAMVMLVSTIPGFAIGEEQTPDISEHVNLQIYLLGSPARDYDMMLEELNKKTNEDLNATVTVNWIGWADYKTKYSLVLASGEPIDLIYVANWAGYYQEAAKGAFLPLEDLVPVYMPESYAELSPDFLQQAIVNGHMYGVPAAFYQYSTSGYIMRGDYMEKYGMDAITSLDDWGAFMANVRENDPEIEPGDFYSAADGTIRAYLDEKGYVQVTFPLVMDIREDQPVIRSLFDEEDALDYFIKMKEWSDAGYWNKSVLTNKDNTMFDNGKAASGYHNQDGWKSGYIEHPEYMAEFFITAPYTLKTAAMQDGMAVPASSKNPERALMFLEKLRQDETYYDLMTYGIEGVHYSVNEDRTIDVLDAEGFSPEGYCSWGFKEPKFYLKPIGLPPNLDEINAQLEALAIVNPYVLFTPDYDPIKNERAAVNNVYEQYGRPLAYGYIDDPVKGFETLVAQLDIAGLRTMQEELQRQLDAFIAQ